jgi:hypothetical protein
MRQPARTDDSPAVVAARLQTLRAVLIVLYLTGVALGAARLGYYLFMGDLACGDSGGHLSWALVPPGPVCDLPQTGSLRQYDRITTVWLAAVVVVPFVIRWVGRLATTIGGWTVDEDHRAVPITRP